PARLAAAVGMVKRFALPALLLALAGCGQSEPMTAGAPPALRLLSESQYRQTIADVFGADIRVGGGFEPEVRQSGLLGVGSSSLTVSPAGLEQYDAKARAIAGQAVGEAARQRLVPCAPENVAAASDACAASFFTAIGPQLLRRPLSEAELAARVRTAHAA